MILINLELYLTVKFATYTKKTTTTKNITQYIASY